MRQISELPALGGNARLLINGIVERIPKDGVDRIVIVALSSQARARPGRPVALCVVPANALRDAAVELNDAYIDGLVVPSQNGRKLLEHFAQKLDADTRASVRAAADDESVYLTLAGNRIFASCRVGELRAAVAPLPSDTPFALDIVKRHAQAGSGFAQSVIEAHEKRLAENVRVMVADDAKIVCRSGDPRGSAQSMGGFARAAALSPARRSEIAKHAAQARWRKPDVIADLCGEHGRADVTGASLPCGASVQSLMVDQ